MPDWLLTVTTRKPAWLSWRIASPAPGNRRTFPGSCRNPGSSTMVPSRSRKTALAIECGPDGSGSDVDLIRQQRPRVEHHAVACDARDHGRRGAAQPLEQRIGRY